MSPGMNEDGDDASVMIAMLSKHTHNPAREKSETVQSQISIMDKIKDKGAKLLGYIFGGNQNEGKVGSQ